jgi:hypothetical protein
LEKIRREWNEREKDYLLKILSFYNQMLLSKSDKKKVFIIDTDELSPEEVLKEVEEKITEISGYLFTKLINQPSTQMNLLRFLK